MHTLLAVITDWDLAEPVLNRASQLARAYGAELVVYRPVHDQLEEMDRYVGFDNFETLQEEILEENRSRMAGLLEGRDLDYEVEWQSRVYRGIADKAEQTSADMIVVAMDEHSVLGDLLHRPDDWHLLRDAPCPVLLISRHEHPLKAVVAAVDCLDDSEANLHLAARVLDQGRALADAMDLPLDVVSVVPDPVYAYADIAASAAAADFRTQAEKTALTMQGELISRLAVTVDRRRVVSGAVVSVLEEAIADAGLLVLGTLAKRGIRGLFVGNTAERILRHVDGDMLVVN